MDDALKSAVALKAGGKLSEASRAFQGILDNDPHNYDALRHLGLLDVRRGKTEGVQLIEKAIQQQPTQAHAYLDLGSAFHCLKQWPEALKSYGQFIRQNPQHAHAHFLCGAGGLHAPLLRRAEVLCSCARHSAALCDGHGQLR